MPFISLHLSLFLDFKCNVIIYLISLLPLYLPHYDELCSQVMSQNRLLSYFS